MSLVEERAIEPAGNLVFDLHDSSCPVLRAHAQCYSLPLFLSLPASFPSSFSPSFLYLNSLEEASS